MSMPEKIEIECPHCKNKDKFTIWNSVNVDVDPPLREKVKSGELFLFTCKKCKKANLLDYKFLYNDMTNKFWLWYFPNGEFDLEKEMATINNAPIMKIYDGVQRIVDTRENFLEKILIFENKLNDIAIEIVKMVIREKANDMTMKLYYAETSDGMLRFNIEGGRGVSISCDMYNIVLENYDIKEFSECANICEETVFEYAKGKLDDIDSEEDDNSVNCMYCNKIIKNAHSNICDECRVKFDIIKNSSISDVGKQKLLKEMKNFSEKDLKDIILKSTNNGGIACPSCGSMVEKDDCFCTNCGKKLLKEKMYCTNCGNEVLEEWKFCKFCGNEIS